MKQPAKLPAITEAQFQKQVLQAARTFGFLSYHTRYSIGSTRGFPDLVLVKPPRVIFIELKTEAGNTSSYQDEWIEQLRDCPGVECYLWRPSDLEDAIEILMRRP